MNMTKEEIKEQIGEEYSKKCKQDSSDRLCTKISNEWIVQDL